MDDPCHCGEVCHDIPLEDGLVMGDPVAELAQACQVCVRSSAQCMRGQRERMGEYSAEPGHPQALIEPSGKQLMPESKAEACHYVVYPRRAADRLLQLGPGAIPGMDTW